MPQGGEVLVVSMCRPIEPLGLDLARWFDLKQHDHLVQVKEMARGNGIMHHSSTISVYGMILAVFQ